VRRPSASAPGFSTQPDTPPQETTGLLGTVSPPLSPQPQSNVPHHVLETRIIQRHLNRATGNPTINNYELLGEIGTGVHGKVKKAKDLDTGNIVAIKIINRVTKKKIGNWDPNEQENKIKREIAIMKKCQHPNIVKLIEVIDNPNSQKVYLGMSEPLSG
jgi:SNF1-activating kinase 1